MARVLLISEKTLKQNSVINNNVDGMYILPAIEYAQDAGLQPFLGTKLYNKLISDNPTYVQLRKELFPTNYNIDIVKKL